MIKHISPLSGIASYRGQYVLTAGYDNQVILWDAKSRRAMARGMHDHLANQCAFSPDGKLCASSSSDYSVRLWQLPTMRLKTVMTTHEDDVEGLAFHPDKPWIATCSRDHTLCLFDLEGKLLQRFQGHTADVISVAWQGSSDILLSSSDDGTIKRWDANTGCILEDIDLGGIETDTIAITNDGIIYAGNDEGEIIIIDAYGKRQVQAHNAGIKRLVYDADQGMLVSLSYDRQVKVWAGCSGDLECIRAAALPTIVWPRSAAFLDKHTLVFVSFGSSYAEYNVESGEWTLEHIEQTLGINAVCQYNGYNYTVGDAGSICRDGKVICTLPSLCNFFTPMEQSLITGGQTGEVFDAITGQCIYQHRSPLNCGATFVRQGETHVIIGSYTGESLVFKRNESGTIELLTSLKLHQNAIKGICADDELIFSVCADSSVAFVRIDDFVTAKYVENAHDMIANGCASANNGTFVSVSRDLKLRIWTKNSVEVVDTPHKNSIKCVAISADGDTIVTGNYAGFIGVYQRSSAVWTKWYHPSSSGISSLWRDEHGGFLASSYDGATHVLTAMDLSEREVA